MILVARVSRTPVGQPCYVKNSLIKTPNKNVKQEQKCATSWGLNPALLFLRIDPDSTFNILRKQYTPRLEIRISRAPPGARSIGTVRVVHSQWCAAHASNYVFCLLVRANYVEPTWCTAKFTYDPCTTGWCTAETT